MFPNALLIFTLLLKVIFAVFEDSIILIFLSRKFSNIVHLKMLFRVAAHPVKAVADIAIASA